MGTRWIRDRWKRQRRAADKHWRQEQERGHYIVLHQLSVFVVVLYRASEFVCIMPSLPSSLKPSNFLCCPAICPPVRTARCHHISVTPASLHPFDPRHLHNILYIHPKPPPTSLSHSSIFLSFYLDLVQPKTSTFSTHALVWVHYKVVHKISQPIFSLFSHLNSALHNLVIELCSALKTI